MAQNKKHRVFISYHGGKGDTGKSSYSKALELKTYLEQPSRGIECYLCLNENPNNYYKSINKAIEECDWLILVACDYQALKNSVWIERELLSFDTQILNGVKDKHCFISAYVFGSLTEADLCKYNRMIFEFVDITSGDDGFERLYKRIKKAIAERGGQDVLVDEVQIAQPVPNDDKWFADEVEGLDAVGMRDLGWKYDQGDGVPQNYKKALILYTMAAELGLADAQFRVGYFYQFGQGTSIDLKKAREWYQKGAKNGSDLAKQFLATLPSETPIPQRQLSADELNKYGEDAYHGNDGFEKDLALAFSYFKKAAEIGHPQAQSNLAFCYKNGEGTAKDIAKAIYWYTQAANQGHVISQYNLGVFYKNGDGVPKDYKKAVEWYQKAAEQGNVYAQSNLGYCYDAGLGVVRDMKKAVYWYTQAAKQGHAISQSNLANCYEKGLGVTKDYKMAAEWCQKAAERGDATSQNNLAYYYQNGLGVAQDFKKCAYWYKKSAEQGYASGQNNFGVCCYRGDGVAQDYEKAVYWFKLAAEQGNKSAMKSLAFCYQKGLGVKKDSKLAHYWQNKSK